MDLGTLIIFAIAAALCLAAGTLWVRGAGIFRIHLENRARLHALSRDREAAQDPLKKNALEVVEAQVRGLSGRWMLQMEDLKVGDLTRAFVGAIAAAHHPKSSAPLAEARIGQLLDALDELRQRILTLSRLPGLRRATRFRLRHVLYCVRAWEKKADWERSAWGRAVARYRILSLLQWSYGLFRFLDASYWFVKTLGAVTQHFVFKILLVRWYLLVGELALKVYGDTAPGSEIEPEILLQEMGAASRPQEPSGLPPAVSDIASASRKKIWLHTQTLEWSQIRAAYRKLAEDIAAVHHPESAAPLHEARLGPLLMGVSRLADRLAALRSRPVVKQCLDVRLSHVFMVRDAAEVLRQSEVFSWLRKYQIGRIAKISNLIFQTLRKKHPGLLFKDIAFQLVKEGGKRWLATYLHAKIAEEANRIYCESPESPPPEGETPSR